MKLSVIIPVYNEKETIKEILRRVRQVKLDIEKEIIVLDGASTDGTREILEEERDNSTRIVFEEERRGKGAAVREGFRHASGEIIIIQDADLELDPNEYPQLIAPILKGETSVVFGSRFLHGRKGLYWPSYLANRIITLLANLLFNATLTDIATCYKVFKKEAINNLNLCCNGFDFDAEITANILKKGFRIIELPVDYHPRDYTQGKKIHWKDGFRTIYILIKCRILR